MNIPVGNTLGFENGNDTVHRGGGIVTSLLDRVSHGLDTQFQDSQGWRSADFAPAGDPDAGVAADTCSTLGAGVGAL